MTTQEQIRALAELDGWILEPAGQDSFGVHYACFWWHASKQGEHKLPDYLTSYDAIIPLRIQVCNTPELRVKWLNAARVIVGRRCPKNKVEVPIVSDFDIASIQPHEDCEALLRATGKWKD